MKTFKIKDLIVTLNVGQEDPAIKACLPYTIGGGCPTHTICFNPSINGCPVHTLCPVHTTLCLNPTLVCHHPTHFCVCSHHLTQFCVCSHHVTFYCQPTQFYPTDCGGTRQCGGSIEQTIDIPNAILELETMKRQIEEYQQALEAKLQPQTREDFDTLEVSLNEALKEINVQRDNLK